MPASGEKNSAESREAIPTRPFGMALVRGNSMRPTLRPGDRLLVRYGAPARSGAVVVVRLPDGTRAVKRAGVRDPAGWWVESDNPAAPGAVDSWRLGAPVPAEAVLGVVVARVWPRPMTKALRASQRP